MQDFSSGELSDTRECAVAGVRALQRGLRWSLDACVYEINAELSRYDYLLRQIKERSGEAVYKTQRGGLQMGITEKILLVLFAVCCSRCSGCSPRR